jgi:hypothetical protein
VHAGHWANADLAAKAEGMVHGVVAPASASLESAAGAMHIAPQSATAAWSQAQSEAAYARSRVPLGAPVSHGHVLPPALASGERAFGVGPASGQSLKDAERNSLAKAALFPVDAPMGGGPQRLAPGYQPGRRPDAAHDRAAGTSAGAAGSGGSAADALVGDRMGEPLAPRVAEYRERRDALPAAVANARAAGNAAPPFGVSTQPGPSDAGGAGALLRSGYTAEQLVPDARVGRVAPGAHDAPPPPDRTFGVPSVRRDLPPPPVRGIADMRAFGDDAPIRTIIAPTANAATTSAPPMSAGEMEGLLAAAGVPLPPATFARLFAAAAAADALPGGKARLATLQKLRAAAGL